MDKIDKDICVNRSMVAAMNDQCPFERTDDDDTDYDEINNNIIVNLTYYAMVLILGLPGNAIIVQAYAWKKRKTSTDVLIMSQAIIDFIACLFTPALIIRNAFPSLISVNLCRISSLTEESPALASLFLTTAISADRYMVVCHPLRRRITVRRSILLVFVCVVVSVGFNTPLAVSGMVRFSQSSGIKLCDIAKSKSSYVLGVKITYSVLFVVSFVMTTLLYAFIYAFLRKRAKIHADLVSNEIPVATISLKNDISGSLDSSSATNPAFMHDAARKDSTAVTTYKIKFEAVQDSSHVATTGFLKDKTILPSPSNTVTGSNLISTMIKPAQDDVIYLSVRPTLMEPRRSPSSLPQRTLFKHRGANRPKAWKEERDYGRRTTRMLLIITIFFFVTWTPKIIIPLIPRKNLASVRRIPGFNTMFSILLALRLTNHIVNFFVYYSVSKSFRRDVKESLKRCRGRE